ncbi:MAG: 2-oxoglutarate dehydrogenase complex dihydrolipoyllysine-residue succinyltransferase [Desulfobacterales bacterium]|jgi:2-oxoglutarate dehydrogenase E2 component (dihydrolipoamide succinyltransferase)|nr:2-oxoglutarate dehydrogenase complex dihydrolipoyllysine-residue succinyltransferase [Desulfobacterales bacterium]
MASIEIKVPAVGESITEALLAEWFKKDGDTVRKDEALFALETDKVTLEVLAEASGTLRIAVAAGSTVKVGAVVGAIDSAAAKAQPSAPAPAAAEPAAVATAAHRAPAPSPPTATRPAPEPEKAAEPASGTPPPAEGLPPSVRRLAAEHALDVSRIPGTGPSGRITKGDVLLFIEAAKAAPPEKPVAPDAAAGAPACPPCEGPAEEISRKPMSPIRKRIAERLLKARQNTAMLTTFNDVDMSAVIELRQRYKESFQKKYGVSLGFMSFFVKASVEALKAVPEINAFIEGDDILYHGYYHIGVAVGSEKGLIVPVIRHADRLSFAQIEQAIGAVVAKIKENKLQLSDLEGGTFTITNGGVFGSLLSTPILNTPQSGILGMHRVDRRPVAVGDAVVIRPMMYVALSYDHRIVDGREAVTFLKHIKECIENPERIMMEI